LCSINVLLKNKTRNYLIQILQSISMVTGFTVFSFTGKSIISCNLQKQQMFDTMLFLKNVINTCMYNDLNNTRT